MIMYIMIFWGLISANKQIANPTKGNWVALISIAVLLHMMGGWELWHLYMKYWG
jgi:hypothetical protein